MTPKEVEDLVHKKTRTNVPVRTIAEQHGSAAAYLSYSVDDHNQLTIWHTEVPTGAQHLGVGGRLVEQALELTESIGATLRLVCPFAKDYLVRHPELRNGNAAAHGALVERESLTTGEAF
jgi:predicted GNAT family acetyltransferase